MITFESLSLLVLSSTVILVLWSNRALKFWVWMLCLTAVLSVSVAALKRQKNISSRQRAFREFWKSVPNLGRSGGYVSSDQCLSCHPGEYHSWHQSFHRTMTQLPSPENVLGNFSNVDLKIDDQNFRLEKKGDQYWVYMADPEWEQNQAKARAGWEGYKLEDRSRAPYVWKTISMLTGSHHFQVYWVSSGVGTLQHALPFTWIISDKRWVGRKDAFIKNPIAPPAIQHWNGNCIQCHSTAGIPGLNESNLFETRMAEPGIACEACHGPAASHIKANGNPLIRYTKHLSQKTDPHITNPERLSSSLSAQLCGQCHSMRWTLDRQDWMKNGSAFRPGHQLNNSAPPIRPRAFQAQPWLPEEIKTNKVMLENIFWSDGMLRVTGREFNGLLESSCYQKGALSCLSCHSIHNSNPDDQLAPAKDGNQACLQCHSEFASKIESHTHHSPGSSGSLCYNCHMPFATYGLLKAVRNHYIDSPDVNVTLQTGRPNACNLCHLDKTLDWTAQHLLAWYNRPHFQLAQEQKQISSAILIGLRGNVAQRALIAAAFGWNPAADASGKDWNTPILLQLMDDPYPAVRYIAARSFHAQHPNSSTAYDFLDSKFIRSRNCAQMLQEWKINATFHPRPEVLIESSGLDEKTIERLQNERDNRIMDLVE